MTAVLRIGWVTVRELLFERVFYILLSFCVLSFGLSVLLGQLTYQTQSKLILDFMLGGIHLSAVLFSVFMGISLFQREIHQGSIHMVLSKPIARFQFLLGKFFGQLTVLWAVIAGMGLTTLALCGDFPTFSTGSLLQTLILVALEATVLTSLTYLFAVNAGAITSAVVVLCLFALGHVRDTVNQNIGDSVGALGVWEFTKTLVPHLEIFNAKSFASYGLMLPWDHVLWAFIYAALCIGTYLLMAALCFDQKDIT